MKIVQMPEDLNRRSEYFGLYLGELYSGDVTVSGRPVQKASRYYPSRSKQFDAIKMASSGSAYPQGMFVDVPGSLMNVQGTANFLAVANPLQLRGAQNQPFESKRGVTAGKTLFQHGHNIIVNQDYEQEFSISGDALNSANASVEGVSSFFTNSRIVGESDTHLFVHQFRFEDGGNDESAFYALHKVTGALIVVLRGRFDLEYLGEDTNSNPLFWINAQQLTDAPASFSFVGTGVDAGCAQYLMRGTPTPTAVGNFVQAYVERTGSGVASGASGRTNCVTLVSSDTPVIEYDVNGKVAAFTVLATDDTRATCGSNTFPGIRGGYYVNWCRYVLNAGVLTRQLLQRIDITEYEGAVFNNQDTSYGKSSSLIQCVYFVEDNQLYAVFSNGSALTYLPSDSRFQAAILPTMLLRAPINEQKQLGTLEWQRLDLATTPRYVFNFGMLDKKAKKLWQVSSMSFRRDFLEVRCLSLSDVLCADYGYVSGKSFAMGAVDGRLLAVVQVEGNSVRKYQLVSDAVGANVTLSFDKIEYQVGETATLTIKSDVELLITVELNGCTFSDTSDSKEISVLGEVQLPVTVKAPLSASVSNIRLPEEVVE